MTTNEAIRYFGSKRALWEFLELRGKRMTIYQWGDRPPMPRQYQLELLTNGHLRADDYRRRKTYDKAARPAQ